MKNSELFAIISGTIGFIMNLVGLFGIWTGWVTLPDASFFKSPLAFGIVTYFAMIYSVMLVLYFWSSSMTRKWERSGKALSLELKQNAVRTVAAILWLPLFWLWAVVIVDAGHKAEYWPGTMLFFAIFWFFNTAAAAQAFTVAVETLYMFHTPTAKLVPSNTDRL
jgi:hypothetical protein